MCVYTCICMYGWVASLAWSFYFLPFPLLWDDKDKAAAAAAAAKLLQSYPTLCDPIDSSQPGSPVPGILQARMLEWVAISFSSAWNWKVKVKSLSRVWPLATPWTAAYQAPPSMGFSRQEYWSGLPSCSPKDKASWKQKPGVKTNHWHLLQKFIAKEEFWFFKELLGQSQQDNSFHGEKGGSSLHLRAQMKYWLGLDMIWIYKFLSALSLQICSVPVWSAYNVLFLLSEN